MKVQLVIGEYSLEALPDAVRVPVQCVRGDPLSLARLAARIPDLSRGAADNREDMVSRTSEMQEADDGQQVTHMEAVRRGVEAAVNRLTAGLQHTGELIVRGVLGERLLQNPPFVQRLQQSAVQGGGTVEVLVEGRITRR